MSGPRSNRWQRDYFPPAGPVREYRPLIISQARWYSRKYHVDFFDVLCEAVSLAHRAEMKLDPERGSFGTLLQWELQRLHRWCQREYRRKWAPRYPKGEPEDWERENALAQYRRNRTREVCWHERRHGYLDAVDRDIRFWGRLDVVRKRDDYARVQPRNYKRCRDALKDAYTRARLAWADFWAERILGIALDDSQDVFYDNNGNSHIDHARIQRHRLQVDTAKWLASKYAPKVYGDKPAIEGPSEPIVIRWARRDSEPAPPPVQREPRQITYQKPQLPADLTERDWSVMLEVLELVKRTIPTNSDSAPSEVFDVIRQALLAHFRDAA